MVQQGDETTADGTTAGTARRRATSVRSRARRVRATVRARLLPELRVGGASGVVLAVVAAVCTAWWAGPSWATPALVLVAAAGALLAVVDARTHRLPDVIVLPAWLGAVVLLTLAALDAGDTASLVRALAGGALGFAAYAALRLAYPPGLGFGDVKLAGLLSTPLAWLGWSELVAGLVLPFLLGGVWAVGLLATRRASRSTAVPFGPFMVLGAVLAVVLAAAGGDALPAAGLAG